MANAKHLVIVESPSKAKTIGKFLGPRYKVIASVGHVRDLPKSKLGIDIENDFDPQYISIRGKGDVIKALRKEAKKADKIYLATDPDREGEAISWHIAYLLGIETDQAQRIVFNEITKNAIKNAVKNPRNIDLKLVDAQQARRVLDRLVGYQISPLLWRKIRRGLSAGRVQSATLKLICDRENLINNFQPEEFWNITATLQGSDKKSFSAKLMTKGGKKIAVDNGKDAEAIYKELSGGSFQVAKVDMKERKKNPAAPFTTSSLQQDAANKLNFNTKKTMMVAQQLYEGVEVKGHGTIGLVSYIRTDSVRVSDEAKAASKAFIEENFGKEYYKGTVYSNKKKEVQDAHEAIRPSYIELTPDEIKDSLSRDQYKLYKLVWSRFLASQMTSAIYDAMSVDIVNGQYGLKASGSKIKFDGYRRVYEDGLEKDESKMLPHMEEGETLKEKEILKEQNFTQPPARYTEASLVKELEDKNIGRPSTYAPIIATLTDRRYVKREKKSLIPTELGFLVTDLMEKYFKEIVDVGFTADLEDKLDAVESRHDDWKQVIRDFYGVFEKELEVADKEIEKVQIEDELTGELCEICGKPMAKKYGRNGYFIACTGYPECKNTKSIVEEVGVNCPSCGKPLLVKRSQRGRIFYGCSGYPDCNQVYWNKPVDKKCPDCGSLLVEKKTRSTTLACSNAQCKYKE